MMHKLSIYQQELKNKSIVREDKIRYMVMWVGEFLAFGQPDSAVFADSLEREGRQGWQIRQDLDLQGCSVTGSWRQGGQGPGHCNGQIPGATNRKAVRAYTAGIEHN